MSSASLINNLTLPDEVVSMVVATMNESRSRLLPLVLAAASEKERRRELQSPKMDAHRNHEPGRANLQVCPTNLPVHGDDSHDCGFTLVELLVVIAIIAILAVTLLPALAASKASTKADQCMSNTHQMTLAWAMYASDNRQQLVSSANWVLGVMTWTANPDNQNTNLLVGPMPSGQPQPLLGKYLHDPRIFKDPADHYQTTASGYRVRSYSMNGALGNTSGPSVQGTAPDGRKYYGTGGSLNVNAVKMSDLIHPAMVFVILDEQADSINDGKFMFNPGSPPGQEKWRDLPASYYNGAGCLSFADGHSVIHHWQDSRTIYPVTYSSSIPWKSLNLVISPDYEWMDDHMPYR